MLPGLGGFDPKKMNALMKQMGISQDEIPASKVIIETTDNKRIIIENPSVTKINMQGHDSFQVIGDVREETGMPEDDIKTIMERTGCTQKQAKKALEKTGDLAEAILELSD
jgi:nascent polypeptide-associated complex subunit alpha